MRVFVGLPIHPDEPLHALLLQQGVARLPQGCVPMPANEWHCTLAGPLAIEQEQLVQLRQVVENSIAKARFALRARAGLLHSQWDKNTTALELAPNQELLRLQQRIQEKLLSITHFRTYTPWRPHISLGRGSTLPHPLHLRPAVVWRPKEITLWVRNSDEAIAAGALQNSIAQQWPLHTKKEE